MWESAGLVGWVDIWKDRLGREIGCECERWWLDEGRVRRLTM